MTHPIEVGKAYLCSDGLIRWMTRQTEDGRYQVLVRGEDDMAWRLGGHMVAEQWAGGEEVEAPPMETVDEARRLAHLAFEEQNEPHDQ